MGEFQAQRGSRSLAPVYKTSTEKHGSLCGIKCHRKYWCMGFNVIGNGTEVICQFIAVKQNDTQVGMALDDSSSYYERVRG